MNQQELYLKTKAVEIRLKVDTESLLVDLFHELQMALKPVVFVDTGTGEITHTEGIV